MFWFAHSSRFAAHEKQWLERKTLFPSHPDGEARNVGQSRAKQNIQLTVSLLCRFDDNHDAEGCLILPAPGAVRGYLQRYNVRHACAAIHQTEIIVHYIQLNVAVSEHASHGMRLSPAS